MSLKNRKTRLEFAKKKHLKKPEQFWKNILWTDETQIYLYQNDGKSTEKGRNCKNDENCVNVQIFIDLTVNSLVLNSTTCILNVFFMGECHK